MITCTFENGDKARGGLRHVAAGAIAVNEKKEILLVKRAPSLLNGGKYTVPGGFLDRDESTAQGVLRELLEETGYRGEILTLFEIVDSPNRQKEDRQNVDFRYVVKIIGGQPILSDETTEIRWMKKEELPSEENFAFDYLPTILRYFDYLEHSFPLPIFTSQ